MAQSLPAASKQGCGGSWPASTMNGARSSAATISVRNAGSYTTGGRARRRRRRGTTLTVVIGAADDGEARGTPLAARPEGMLNHRAAAHDVEADRHQPVVNRRLRLAVDAELALHVGFTGFGGRQRQGRAEQDAVFLEQSAEGFVHGGPRSSGPSGNPPCRGLRPVGEIERVVGMILRCFLA